MDNRPHYIWAFVVIAIVGVIAWIYAANRPDTYEKGSLHAEQHRQDWPLSIHIGEGGCATIDKNGKFLKSLTNTIK